MKLKDLTGQTFGYLTVLERAENYYTASGHSKVMWKCRCKCGTVKNITAEQLISGSTKSCGCYNLEKAKLPKEYLRKTNKYYLGTYEYAIGYDSNGNSFLFDKDDYELVSQFCWHKHHDYFIAKDIRKTNGKSIYLHKLIMNCEYEGRKILVDHINGDKGDCRKENLRYVNASENNRNHIPYGKSGISGVKWHTRDNTWEVMIRVDGKDHYIGRTDDFAEAVKMRAEAEEKYHGKYGYLKSRNINVEELIEQHNQMEVV